MHRGRLRWSLAIGAAAALYFGAAQAGFAMAFLNGTVSSVWVPTGLALAFILLGGRRLWPAIVLGEFAANLVHGTPAAVSLAFGFGDAAEGLIAAALLEALGFSMNIDRPRDVFALLGAAVTSTTIGATVGTAGLDLGAGLPSAQIWGTWHTWWAGDATGDLIVVPLLLALWSVKPGIAAIRRHRRLNGRTVEAGAYVLTLAAGAATAQRVPPALAFMVLPVLLWGAMRFGQLGATLANAVLSVAGALVAAHATGSLSGITLVHRVELTQVFIGIAATTTLLTATISAARARAVQQLQASEAAAHALAVEQTALGRVATAIASEVETAELLSLACEEVARLLRVPAAIVTRDAGAATALVIGSWSQPWAPAIDVGAAIHIQGSEKATINLRGEPWGTLAIHPQPLTRTSGASLRRFAGLLGMGLASADARANLMVRASTDALTGLANHRAFHERLAAELVRARRYGRPLSIVLFDIDRFKQVNDTVGHRVGDEVLAEVARRIGEVLREDTLVARLGGDELAAILPECEAETARRPIERARAAVASAPIGPAGTVTLSAGICDSSHADSADRLLELADGALYWAKGHGRDACVTYSPEVVSVLSEAERADRLARSQAVVGLRALALATDAKDPATARHSERVADLAAALARARDWSEPRIELLREAALVHDVGKIGVPDAILQIPGRLTADEYDQVKRHAALGADIAKAILHPEQVSWIRWHHERPDGNGYPDGLKENELPEGAALLSLADAWEAMTSTRAYSPAMPEERALNECRRNVGRQFTADAVQALERAHKAQRLDALAA
jgi:diguanylate cyclase (GGDEF)-like protein/putative nucleotidyltransferase with HDIG domain